MKNLVIILALFSLLSSCGGRNREGGGSLSGLNPFNWFSRPAVELEVAEEVRDTRNFAAEVLDLRAEPTKGGAILHAIGLAQTQGYYAAELVTTTGGKPDENGVLSFEFRMVKPDLQVRVGSNRSREVHVATFVSNQTLRSTKSLEVIAAHNRRAIHR